MLEYSQRLKRHARNVLAGGPDRSTGRALYQAAASGGATALAQPMGALAAGCRADFVVLDPDHPALLGRDGEAVVDSFVFCGGNEAVRDVFIGGRQIVKDRRHIARGCGGRALPPGAGEPCCEGMMSDPHRPTIVIGPDDLTLDDIRRTLAGPVTIAIAPSAATAIAASHALVDALLATGEPIYGVNTGFGKLAKARIADADLKRLQINLVRSHAAGTGQPLAPEIVRLILLLKIKSLSRGTFRHRAGDPVSCWRR